MDYRGVFVRRDQHRIHVREYPGQEPPIILMHGFQDNLHLYDRLFPYLSPPRRVIAFDFLGWGASDKPAGYPYTAPIKSVTWMPSSPNCGFSKSSSSRTTPLVHLLLTGLLSNSERVAGLVLLNTYYCAMPTLRPPEAIWLFSTPVVRNIARPGVADVWSLDLPSHVSVAGWEIFQRRGGQKQVRATAVSTVRCHAKRSSCLLSLERRLVAHNQVTHKNAPEA